MDLVRFDPFSLLSEMDRLFERGVTATPTWAPRIDAFDREKELVIRVELPGVKPEDVDVTVEDRTLTISGKREAESGSISVRKRGENTSVTMKVDEFIDKLRNEIASHS